jgi:hypothetical protein
MAASDNALFLFEQNVLLWKEDVFKLSLLTRQRGDSLARARFGVYRGDAALKWSQTEQDGA